MRRAHRQGNWTVSAAPAECLHAPELIGLLKGATLLRRKGTALGAAHCCAFHSRSCVPPQHRATTTLGMCMHSSFSHCAVSADLTEAVMKHTECSAEAVMIYQPQPRHHVVTLSLTHCAATCHALNGQTDAAEHPSDTPTPAAHGLPLQNKPPSPASNMVWGGNVILQCYAPVWRAPLLWCSIARYMHQCSHWNTPI